MNTSTKSGGTLAWKHFPAGPDGFFRAPVLLTGPTEALLIDGGFTLADGLSLVEAIRIAGKQLTTIYVSQSDPDYYFSLKPVCDAFPNARVIGATATIEAIERSVEKKLAAWGPQLQANGPQGPADLVFPEPFDDPTLTVDGEVVEIVPAADGLANRRYLFVPSLDAIFGGVMIFSGVHVWTADTQTKAGRAAWVKTLEAIIARNPTVVVPGHLAIGAAIDLSAVEFTRSYLRVFEEELAKASDSAELNAAISARFPGLEMGIALDIGSKVAMKEMDWG